MDQIQSITVEGVLLIDGKVLVIRRSKTEKSDPGVWEFPKGKVEFGESPEEALRREFIEETGLSLGPIRLSDAYDYTYKRDNKHRHVIALEYSVDLAEGQSIAQIKLDPIEHDEWLLADLEVANKLTPMQDHRRASLRRALGDPSLAK